MNHWRAGHGLCEECPLVKKILHRVELVLTWTVGIAVVAFLLWFSPAIYHRVAEWSQIYSACVDAAPQASTLGDVLEARAWCARQANAAMRGR